MTHLLDPSNQNGGPRASPAGEEAAAFLTIDQAAQRAQMSRSAIYDACNRKLIAHYRMSGSGRRGKILIRPADLDVFIESRRVEVEVTQASSLPVGLRHIQERA